MESNGRLIGILGRQHVTLRHQPKDVPVIRHRLDHWSRHRLTDQPLPTTTGMVSRLQQQLPGPPATQSSPCLLYLRAVRDYSCMCPSRDRLHLPHHPIRLHYVVFPQTMHPSVVNLSAAHASPFSSVSASRSSSLFSRSLLPFPPALVPMLNLFPLCIRAPSETICPAFLASTCHTLVS